MARTATVRTPGQARARVAKRLREKDRHRAGRNRAGVLIEVVIQEMNPILCEPDEVLAALASTDNPTMHMTNRFRSHGAPLQA